MKWYNKNQKRVVCARGGGGETTAINISIGETIKDIVKKFEEDGTVANKTIRSIFRSKNTTNISKISKNLKNLHDTQKESLEKRII